VKLYREQGVVLRGYKLGEADRILVLMTQGSGKVRAVAKGVRKPTSRFGGRLEPYTHVDVSLHQGRNLDIVSQVEVVDAFRKLRADYDRMTAGTAMLEAVDQVAEEGEPAVRLFLLLVRGLRALDAEPADPSVVLDAFLLKLMAAEGYRPALADCAACGRPGPHARFSVARGGALCANCRTGVETVLRDGTIPLLSALLDGELRDVPACESEPLTRREAGNLVRAFVEYHLDRRLRSYPLVAR
jgi:DNA repair protein RecO (recombination protein O)